VKHTKPFDYSITEEGTQDRLSFSRSKKAINIENVTAFYRRIKISNHY
jgi:hypothetical protein